MKRIVMGILALLLIFSTGIPSAYAAGYGHRRSGVKVCAVENGCTQSGSCPGQCRFVDADGDGICDNRDTQCQGCDNWQDQNGDGICDSCTGAHKSQEENSCPRQSSGVKGRHCMNR